ncbi:Integral peroxisomal membrane peroxin [Phytophthora infestans]|uniref:Integral peroxisomal membrane peroxin n=1 Tax=Phytophthora infestans TaxID=4787 RepID=A0A833T3W2_PHYIN|nr:Integral peroxisomal membrane peroxin [Phytophthora infestans]KAF4136632.1 Integral peroxisomal membrane peroxin [Phytophthora infestans]
MESATCVPPGERLGGNTHAFLDLFMVVTVGLALCVVLFRVLFTVFPMPAQRPASVNNSPTASPEAPRNLKTLDRHPVMRATSVRDRLERETRVRLPRRSTYYSMPFFADTVANKQEFVESLVELGDAPLDGWLLVKKGLQRGKHWKKRYVVLDAHARVKYYPNADAARRNTNVKGSLAVHAVKPADPFEFGANTLEIRGTLGGTYFFRAEDDMAARSWLCVLTMRAIQGHVPGRIDSVLSAAVASVPSQSQTTNGGTAAPLASKLHSFSEASENGFNPLNATASALNLLSSPGEDVEVPPVRLKSHALELVVQDMSYDKDASLRQFYVVAKFKSELHDYSSVPVGQTSPKPRGEKGEKGAVVKWNEKLTWHFQDHLCSECQECRSLGAMSGAFCGLPDIMVLHVYEIHLRYLTTKIGEVSLSLRELLGFTGMRTAQFTCAWPVTSTRDAILGQLMLSLKYSVDNAGGAELMQFLVTSADERELVGEYPLHASLTSAYDFFNNFLANGTSDRLSEYYKERGDTEIEAGDWTPSKEFGGQTRTMSCRSPTNASIGPSHTMTTTTDHVPFDEGGIDDSAKLVMQSKVFMHDIPYGDCFSVEKVTVVERVPSNDGSPGQLVAKIYLGVPFSKGCMFKSKIISATREAMASSSKLYFHMVNRSMESLGASMPATPVKPFLVSTEEERQVVGEYELHPAIKDGLHFFDLFYANNTLSRWQTIHQEAGDTEHVVGKWEESEEYGGQVREMKYRAKSTSPLGPSSTMAEQIVHVPFSPQDRNSLDADRIVIEHKLTLLEIPYGDCFHVETVYVIEPRTDAMGSALIAKVYIGIPFSKSTMFKSKIMSATKEGVVKSTKMVVDGLNKAVGTEVPVDSTETSRNSIITEHGRGRPRRSSSIGATSRRRPSVARYNSTLDGSVALEEIFENQRVSMFGKWAPNHLLPTDRPRFSNRDGDKAMSFEQVSLPPSWSWTTPWRIDKSYTDCDDEGWSYATDFPRFKFHLARGKSSMKRLGASVRRRRWIRMMAYVPPEVNTDSPSPPVVSGITKRRNRNRASQGSSSGSMGS